MEMWCSVTEGTEARMKCLRVYSTADGESHFDEVEIPTTSRQVHPNAAAFEVSAKYAASGIRFTHIPAGARQVDLFDALCERGKHRTSLALKTERQIGHVPRHHKSKVPGIP
jgi:hypothetical protein